MTPFNKLHLELAKSPKTRKAYRKEVCRLEDKKKVTDALATLKKAIGKIEGNCEANDAGILAPNNFAKGSINFLSDYFKEVYKIKK